MSRRNGNLHKLDIVMISFARRTAQAVGGMITSTPRLDPTRLRHHVAGSAEYNQAVAEHRRATIDLARSRRHKVDEADADVHVAAVALSTARERHGEESQEYQAAQTRLGDTQRRLDKLKRKHRHTETAMRDMHGHLSHREHAELASQDVEHAHRAVLDAERDIPLLNLTKLVSTMQKAPSNMSPPSKIRYRKPKHMSKLPTSGCGTTQLSMHCSGKKKKGYVATFRISSSLHTRARRCNSPSSTSRISKAVSKRWNATSSDIRTTRAQSGISHHLASAHLLTHHHNKVERLEKSASSGSASERQAAAKKLKKQRDKLTQHEKYHARLLVQHPHLAEKSTDGQPHPVNSSEPLDTRIQAADRKVHADHEHLARAEHELQQDPKRADVQALTKETLDRFHRLPADKRTASREGHLVLQHHDASAAHLKSREHKHKRLVVALHDAARHHGETGSAESQAALEAAQQRHDKHEKKLLAHREDHAKLGEHHAVRNRHAVKQAARAERQALHHEHHADIAAEKQRRRKAEAKADPEAEERHAKLDEERRERKAKKAAEKAAKKQKAADKAHKHGQTPAEVAENAHRAKEDKAAQRAKKRAAREARLDGETEHERAGRRRAHEAKQAQEQEQRRNKLALKEKKRKEKAAHDEERRHKHEAKTKAHRERQAAHAQAHRLRQAEAAKKHKNKLAQRMLQRKKKAATRAAKKRAKAARRAAKAAKKRAQREAKAKKQHHKKH
ncbi:hypothetical protein Rhopal_000175-T1 [Rhodotorula paludigena]|uniref:Uncharacterized protein n=1 Tax=Rhodotorula paludigena TaxID=86838 RepID=A0AAV5G4K7_9BASI|nr:hypothetical protein Rhopal_000175-T1 [Rhodotorula paludigena]